MDSDKKISWFSQVNPVISQINFWAGLLLVFLIPFHKKIIVYSIGLFFITWLLEGGFQDKFKSFKQNRLVFFLITGFYLVNLLSLFYTSDKADGFFKLEKMFSFLLFPVIIVGLNELYKKNFLKLLYSFIVGNLIAAFICLLYALYNSIVIKNGSWSFNPSFNACV